MLIGDDGVAKICDFGYVRLVHWQGIDEISADIQFVDTNWYTAPELLITPRNPSPIPTFEGDIYVLGCTVLEVSNSLFVHIWRLLSHRPIQIVEGIAPFQRFKRPNERERALRDGFPPALRSETTMDLFYFTEVFWSFVEACWAEKHVRPVIGEVVEALDHLAHKISV